jgi:hypothetical protein
VLIGHGVNSSKFIEVMVERTDLTSDTFDAWLYPLLAGCLRQVLW